MSKFCVLGVVKTITPLMLKRLCRILFDLHCYFIFKPELMPANKGLETYFT